MKKIIQLLTLFLSTFIFAQDADFNNIDNNSLPINPASNTNFAIYNVNKCRINTSYSEEVAAFYKNKFIITSTRKRWLFTRKDKTTNQPYAQIYDIKMDSEGKLKRPTLFDRRLNSKYHEGSIAFSPDEKTVYFTRSDQHNTFKLYKAELSEKGKWENIELLNINNTYKNIKDLFINTEGTLLYFSSNIDKGYGGYDLYFSDIKQDKTLGEPLNLGPGINTPGDERSPYIPQNKKYLFFSSTAHHSYGGLDIFKSRIIHHEFQKPINLGVDINSKQDDFGYILANNKLGYFSSSRANGNGGSDIYKFNKNEIRQVLQGYVVDKASQVILPNTKITLFDQENNVVQKTLSDKNGYYRFNLIEPQEHYTITTENHNFFTSNIPFNAHYKYNYSYKKDLELIPASEGLLETDNFLTTLVENIYFDYNEASIEKASTISSLKKIVSILKDNPKYTLNIDAHTDNIGSDSYNLFLSKKRAQAVLKYFVKQGISKNRLIAKGHGEQYLIVDCKDKCTKKEHEINRRIEFTFNYE